MDIRDIEELTPHPDVNGVLVLLSTQLGEILGDQLLGLYLTGSLTYGDFDRGSSDIDFLAILHHGLSADQRAGIKVMHARIADTYPLWAARIEGSYITRNMLESTEPPSTPRPYVNHGRMWDPDPGYGNEWLINLYALYKNGIALLGPDPKEILPPIEITLVREASRKDLYEEWKAKSDDPSALNDTHLQAYVILTLCRILYRAQHDGVSSKRVASAWVKRTYGKPWSHLVQRAEEWQHGENLNALDETLGFIRFTLTQVQ